MYAVVWRSALGVIEAEHTDKPHMTLVDRQDLQIADNVSCAYRAALLALDVERSNLLLPLEPIVADREQSLPKIIFMRLAAAVEIHIVPIARCESVEDLPKRHVVGIWHRFRYPNCWTRSSIVGFCSFRDKGPEPVRASNAAGVLFGRQPWGDPAPSCPRMAGSRAGMAQTKF